MKVNTILACFLVALFAVSVFSQVTRISRDQYFAQMEAADDKSASIFPRRLSVIESTSENGTAIEVKKSIYEYSSKDVVRHTVETTSGKDISRAEYLHIGQTYFCKQGKGWKKSKSNCEPQNMTMRPDGDFEEFTVEYKVVNGQNAKVYRWYKAWKYPETSDGKEYFYEQIYSVSSEGLNIDARIKSGAKEGSRGQTTTEIMTYEYNVSIPEIKAPIN